MGFKTLVTTSAALLLSNGVRASVISRWPTAGPSCTNFTPFVYAGCFSDPSSPRALPFSSSSLNTQNMTVEICVAFCKGNDYRYAGLEYYGECFCGASVAGAMIDPSNCNYPCTGNSSETCGGNDILSVYQDPTFPADDTSTISDYQSSGCWTDDSSSGRTLVYQQNQLNGSTLTVEQCLFACKDAGYALAGVEYASQCFCGVVLGNGTTQVDSSLCNMPCNGDSSEICGGPALLNLYVATDLESSQPCTSSPPLPSSTTSSTTSSTSTTSTSSSTTSSTSTTSTSSPTTSSTSSTTSTSSSTTSSTSSTTSTSSSTTSSTSSTTSKTSSTTTTSSAPLCTTTIPPPCEYHCGSSWCSSPLPNWSNPSDCSIAATRCFLQITSCFSNANYPDSEQCWKFSKWCSEISNYCISQSPSSCSKSDCFNKNPPVNPSPSPSVSVYPCSVTSTTKSTTSTTTTKVPVPTCSNICRQPNNPNNGYTSSSPCGGIPLPCLTCNNVRSSYNSGGCFKLYTDPDTNNCPSYGRNSVPKACQDSCQSQYNSCVNVWAQSCKSNNNPWQGDTYNSASQKCEWQYQDCLNINQGVDGGGRCWSWNSGW